MKTKFERERERLEMLKMARDASGMSLDFWVDLTDGLHHSTVARLCGRAALFPKYSQSSGTP